MNWLQKTSQVNDLQTMLMQVAQGLRDVGQVAEYFQSLAPASPDVCEMINTVGRTYQGSEASMGRIAKAAGCQFNPSAEEDPMNPMMNTMTPPDPTDSMEMPSIEFE